MHDTDQWTSPERSREVTAALPRDTAVVTSTAGVTSHGTVVRHRYLTAAQVHFVDVRHDDGITRSHYPNHVLKGLA